MDQREIARLAGVSTATVSRVLNNSGSVSEKKRNKILKIVEEHAYVQNTYAKNLRASSSKTIGFLVSNLSNPFFIEVFKGLETSCRNKGYDIIIGNANEDPIQEKTALDLLISYRVDAIVASFVKPDLSMIEKLRSFNIDVLLLDRIIPGIDTDVVVIDNIRGAMEQVRYLASLGHRQIAVIKGTDFDSNGIERMHGFMKGMKECNLEIDQNYIIEGQFLEDAAYSAAIKLMGLKKPPTAIITHNNLMCMGAYKALRDMHIKIPGDVSLIGFDDFGLADYLDPPVTVIDRPMYEMGEMAGNLIIDRLRGNGTMEYKKVVFPVKLKIRDSCNEAALK